VKLRAHWLADMQVRLTRRSHFLRVVLVLLLLAAFPLLFGDHGLAGSALAAVIFYNPTARSVCALLGYFPAGLYTSIQDACDAAGVVSAAGAGGGRVILSPGLWLISATLLLPNGVMLWGSSPSSVKLQAAPGFVGTTVVRNKVTDGTQEYAWVDGIQVYADDRAASCIVFDKLFVNSGIRNVVAQHATGSGIVYKSSGSLGGPLYIEDTWSLHHGGDCFLIDDLMENVWLRGITAEYPGNGFAGLRIKGANTSGVILDGIHLENYDTLTTCLGIVVDGSQSVDLRGIESIGYGAGAWSDIVKIQNTVSGSPLGISVKKLKAHSNAATNLVNDTVNSRVVLPGTNYYCDEYRTDSITIESPRAVGAAGQPAFGADFANAGGSDLGLRFYKDASGVVHIEGKIATPAGQAASVIIFTLPTGYRPSARLQPVQLLSATGAISSITISSDGGVRTGSALGATAQLSISAHFLPA
jgi:hypothetical protein